MFKSLLFVSCLCSVTFVIDLSAKELPKLPGSPYTMRDEKQPKPPMIKAYPCQVQAPSDAIIIFDGQLRVEMNKHTWKVENGELVPGDNYSISTRQTFGALQIHLEFKTTEWVEGKAPMMQSNGGLHLPGGYEIQILNSFDKQEVFSSGQMGSVFNQYAPVVNASRSPGLWQSLDVVYYPAEYQDKKVVKPATVTVFHNGVLVHYHRKMLGPTQSFKLPSYNSKPVDGKYPLMLSSKAADHLKFRNIWVRPLEKFSQLDQSELE